MKHIMGSGSAIISQMAANGNKPYSLIQFSKRERPLNNLAIKQRQKAKLYWKCLQFGSQKGNNDSVALNHPKQEVWIMKTTTIKESALNFMLLNLAG
jgi:hypothetical protein